MNVEFDYRTRIVSQVFFNVVSKNQFTDFSITRYLLKATAIIKEPYDSKLVTDLQAEIVAFMTERYKIDLEGNINMKEIDITLEDIAAEVMDEHSLHSCEIINSAGQGLIIDNIT